MPPTPRLAPALLAQVVATPAPRWKFVDHRRYRELPETFALLATALAAHEAPAHIVADRPLAEHLATKLRSFLVTPTPEADGTTREPEAQGGLGGWTHNHAAQSLLLARRTPAVWSRLSPDEHHRADLLMQALAVAAHFTLDDQNDYYLLLDGVSLFHKSWNPNHVEGYVGVIAAASLYFGADALNAFFTRFDVAAFLTELDRVNFQNIRRCWTHRGAPIPRLLMHGGTVPVPDGALLARGVVTRGRGVRHPFTFQGITLHDPWALHRTQGFRLFAKAVRTEVIIDGANTSRLLQHRSDARLSPWEGQHGMILEFETMDWGGLRTSAIYAFEAAMIDLATATSFKALGIWGDEAGGLVLERLMAVGMADLEFKLHEGYRGWANGKGHATTWADVAPKGADVIFALWRAYFRGQDARPPPP